ncbi:MAG: hypothetical protein EA350_12265 [Gemmatimonadales bacterium]|nr:MAG: hypothetical protein EA350_12265 [Gemmatimonadales bacterium]
MIEALGRRRVSKQPPALRAPEQPYSVTIEFDGLGEVRQEALVLAQDRVRQLPLGLLELQDLLLSAEVPALGSFLTALLQSGEINNFLARYAR